MSVGELQVLVKRLKGALNATKRVRFNCRGGVKYSKPLQDDEIGLRACIEIARMHGLYGHRGDGNADDRYDRSEQPVIEIDLGTFRQSPHERI